MILFTTTIIITILIQTSSSSLSSSLSFITITILMMIVAPTRELALQIKTVITALGDFLNVRIHACVGGTLVRYVM
jgi:translation initiation factor 4A